MRYIPVREIASLIKVTARNWQADRVPRMGAALAYYIALSLAPTVLILLAIVSLTFGAPAAESRFVSLIQSLVGYQGARAVQTMIEGARQSSKGLAASVLGLLTVFSSSQDALVSGSGCESHADGFGGSVLLTRKGFSWFRVHYVAGMIAWDCRKLVGSDGRDRLVCGRVDGGQGDLFSSLYLLDPGVDLTKTDTLERQFRTHSQLDNRGLYFFGVEDTRGAMPTPAQKGFIERQKGFIERVEFAGIASRHQARIIVFVRLGRANVPEEVVMKGASGTGPNPDITTLPRRYEFVFDGAKVLAAPNNPPVEPPLTSYSVGK